MTVAGRCKVSLLLHFLGSEGIKLYNTSEFAAAVPAEEGVQEVIPAENRDDLDTVVWKFDAHYRHKKYRSIKRHSGISRLQARRRWATWILLLTWSTRQKSVRPPRPVPAPIRNQVKKELDHLEESGIITKVTKPAPWQIPTRAYSKQTATTSRCLYPHHLTKPYRENTTLSTPSMTSLRGWKAASTFPSVMRTWDSIRYPYLRRAHTTQHLTHNFAVINTGDTLWGFPLLLKFFSES